MIAQASRTPTFDVFGVGARGRFLNVVDLVSKLGAEAYAGRRRQGRMADLLPGSNFPIFDEVDYLPFAQTGNPLVIHLVSKLYERTSGMVITNLAVVEGRNVFGDAKMTPALLDTSWT